MLFRSGRRRWRRCTALIVAAREWRGRGRHGLPLHSIGDTPDTEAALPSGSAPLRRRTATAYAAPCRRSIAQRQRGGSGKAGAEREEAGDAPVSAGGEKMRPEASRARALGHASHSPRATQINDQSPTTNHQQPITLLPCSARHMILWACTIAILARLDRAFAGVFTR